MIFPNWPIDTLSEFLSLLKDLLLLKSIMLEPIYVEAYSYIGSIYIENNNFSLAVKFLKKSLQIKPDSLSSNINLGLIYRKSGKQKAALKYFSK